MPRRNKRQDRLVHQRKSRFECLERFEMMAAAIWNNVVFPVDVSGNQPASVEPLDVLILINELNLPRFSNPANGLLPKQTVLPQAGPYLDVDCDGRVSPLDVLVVINNGRQRINTQSVLVAIVQPHWGNRGKWGSVPPRVRGKAATLGYGIQRRWRTCMIGGIVRLAYRSVGVSFGWCNVPLVQRAVGESCPRLICHLWRGTKTFNPRRNAHRSPNHTFYRVFETHLETKSANDALADLRCTS